MFSSVAASNHVDKPLAKIWQRDAYKIEISLSVGTGVYRLQFTTTELRQLNGHEAIKTNEGLLAFLNRLTDANCNKLPELKAALVAHYPFFAGKFPDVAEDEESNEYRPKRRRAAEPTRSNSNNQFTPQERAERLARVASAEQGATIDPSMIPDRYLHGIDSQGYDPDLSQPTESDLSSAAAVASASAAKGAMDTDKKKPASRQNSFHEAMIPHRTSSFLQRGMFGERKQDDADAIATPPLSPAFSDDNMPISMQATRESIASRVKKRAR